MSGARFDRRGASREPPYAQRTYRSGEEVKRADSVGSVYGADERWFRFGGRKRERQKGREKAKEVAEESLTWMGCGSDGRQG